VGYPTKIVNVRLLVGEAGAEHRFLNFSEDFADWVIFWGPSGGEAAFHAT
jgi:hypothetical protein